MEDVRLKGDETYPQCPYCRKPIRDNQDSIGVSIPGGPGATLHSECFHKRAQELIKNPSLATEGRNDMVGTQTVMDPETGEIMDIDALKELYTETSISGKQTIKERMKLGEMVRVEMVGQVVNTGEALDNDGVEYHVQKIKLFSIDGVERGAL